MSCGFSQGGMKSVRGHRSFWAHGRRAFRVASLVGIAVLASATASQATWTGIYAFEKNGNPYDVVVTASDSHIRCVSRTAWTSTRTTTKRKRKRWRRG